MSYFPEDLKVKLEQFQEDIRKALKDESNIAGSFFPEETPSEVRDSIAFGLHEKFPGKVGYFYKVEGNAAKGEDSVLILGLGVNM